MRCTECEQLELVKGPVTLTGRRNGESFLVDLVGWRCQACGFQTVDSQQSATFTKLLSDAYREKHDLLTGREIQSRRKALRMSQSQFSQYLGVGIASVKRWEAGQVQEGAMDQLIRLKTDPKAAKQNLDTVRAQHTGQHGEIVQNEVQYDRPHHEFLIGPVSGFDKVLDCGSVVAA